ncbi:MAG TPA: rhomboid family intramembrane serine protease, partial [Planctomycetota bacterium]|nr:rhomboid family intramembrane serine protease [Planctomycetota bacterium]
MIQEQDAIAVEQELPSWVELRRTSDRRKANELALVLQAMQIEHGLWNRPSDSVLLVRPGDALRAAEECERYERENLDWPPRAEAIGNLSEGLIGAFGWFAIFSVMELFVRMDALGLDWLRAGRGLAGAERAGEIWRAITGLTLHVDLSHFLSNLLFGALFTMLVCELVGGGLGLLLILVAGATGNFVNALLQHANHASIGASTAVFSALGLLVTYQWRRRHQLRQNAFRRWAPLFAGGFLLATL